MADDSLYNPKGWGDFIVKVGPPFTVIFVLLAILAYLAFKGVPAIVDLKVAIQANTDQTAMAVRAIQEVGDRNVANTTAIIRNQDAIIQQHDAMNKILASLTMTPTGPQTNAYDAEDRSQLWKQHKRDLERIDELSRKLDRLDKQK